VTDNPKFSLSLPKIKTSRHPLYFGFSFPKRVKLPFSLDKATATDPATTSLMSSPWLGQN